MLRRWVGVDLFDETAFAVRAHDVAVFQEVYEAVAAVAPIRRRSRLRIRIHVLRSRQREREREGMCVCVSEDTRVKRSVEASI